MNGYLIFGIIVALLLLISLVRVGGYLAYGEAGLRIKLRLGRLHLSVYPMKPRREKPKREKKQKAGPRPEQKPAEPRSKRDTWALLKEMFPVVIEVVGRFRKKVRIDRLDMDLTVAAEDPATAAVAFGTANALIGMTIPILENNFNMKERNLRTGVDFNRTIPAVELAAAFSLTIGQGLVLSASFAFRTLRVYFTHRKSVQKQKEAV